MLLSEAGFVMSSSTTAMRRDTPAGLTECVMTIHTLQAAA